MISRIFTPIFLGCILSVVVVTYANQTTDHFRDDVSGILQIMPSEVNEESCRGLQLAKESYQNNNCLKEYNSKNTLLLEELKNETISCTESANQLKHFASINAKEFRSKILDDTRKIYEKCDSEDGYFKHVNCLQKIFNETHFEEEIGRRTAELFQEFQNIDKVESECLSKNIDQSKVKSEFVFCNLHNCLLGNSEPFLQHEDVRAHAIENISIKEDAFACACRNIADYKPTGILVPSKLEKCLQYDLKKLKAAYKNLETCVADKKSQFNNCMERTEILLKNLKNRLIEISSNNANEINAYDRTENTCLRHFITGYIFPGFSLTFDLEKCLKNGFKGAVVTGNESENLIYGFWNLRIALWSCRVDSNKTNIEKCISETLDTSNEARAISRTIHSISEDELKNPNNKVYESFNNENDCTGYIFEKLKFRGLFMENLAKNEFKECINRRYVASQDKVFIKDAINKYRSIANSLDKCTQYPDGSEFSTCVSENIGASASSLNYIQQNFKNFSTDTSSSHKCLEKILNRKDELFSSNTNTSPEFEKCLSIRKQEQLAHQDISSNFTIGSLEAGDTLTVTGYILPKLISYSINLIIDSRTSALHVNPRPETIVVNAFENGGWPGKELVFPLLPTYNLHRGSKSVMRISVTDSFYIISINGVELTNFEHRLPYKSVGYVVVYGNMDYISLDRN